MFAYVNSEFSNSRQFDGKNLILLEIEIKLNFVDFFLIWFHEKKNAGGASVPNSQGAPL